jgi:hypothetical protein
MGDPGLGAIDLVDIALPHRARAQAAEVGAGIGLGEDRRRQYLAAGDDAQPAGLLLLRAAEADQLGGDLRARAQRSHADIGAAQRLRHQAHRHLAEAEAAELLRHGQAEDAHLGQLADQLDRDQLVLRVPFRREGRDLGGAEAQELLARRLQHLVVEAQRAEAALGQFGTKARRASSRPARSDERGRAGSVANCASASAGTPISAGRIISDWLIGMPPASCWPYSAKPSRSMAASAAPACRRPAACRPRQGSGAGPRHRWPARTGHARELVLLDQLRARLAVGREQADSAWRVASCSRSAAASRAPHCPSEAAAAGRVSGISELPGRRRTARTSGRPGDGAGIVQLADLRRGHPQHLGQHRIGVLAHDGAAPAAAARRP